MLRKKTIQLRLMHGDRKPGEEIGICVNQDATGTLVMLELEPMRPGSARNRNQRAVRRPQQVGHGGPAIFHAHAADLGVKLTGQLPDWVSARDVILEMPRRHGVESGVGKIVEYDGPGLDRSRDPVQGDRAEAHWSIMRV
jgi:hypothetical protein